MHKQVKSVDNGTREMEYELFKGGCAEEHMVVCLMIYLKTNCDADQICRWGDAVRSI